MTQPEYQREVLAFDQSIALAELEEVKAMQRTRELKFQKAQFILEVQNALMKEQPQPSRT